MSNEHSYGINDIETLSFKDGVRQRIAMYLGSADMQGVYNAIQEIISNSIDEYYMGYGNEIDIELCQVDNEQVITIVDRGRGIPFGIKPDGTNVLVDIFSKPHTGGKFNDKVYNSVAGLNGIGAKATCLSSSRFYVSSYRDGKQAEATWRKGELSNYFESTLSNNKHGTTVSFVLDPEVYNLEPIKIDFEVLCNRCKNLSYLTKGLTFNLINSIGGEKYTVLKEISYCAKGGLLDLIKANVNDPVHSTPVYFEMEEDNLKVEVALMWTKGKEKSFTFTNGLHNSEGGTSLTGVKTAITTFMKKQFKNGFDADMARTGLVYAVSCKVPNPSFANQTKTKINNPELRGLCQRATGKALNDFALKKSADFQKILDFLTREQKANLAAERARKKVMDGVKEIENNSKKKMIMSDKLSDAEFLGQDSILLIVEGDSAASAVSKARDYTKYGILAIRGKMINCLSNPDDKIFENEEIKLLLSAMNIIPGKYDNKKLRYGKIAICTDADSDGGHIGLLIMAALHYLAPQFINEGRLCWLRSPLYIVKNGKKESYYFTDEEFNKVRNSVKGEVQRNKGLGALNPKQARTSMFTEEYQRLDTLSPSPEANLLLEELMGVDVEPRREFVFNKIDFSTIRE